MRKTKKALVCIAICLAGILGFVFGAQSRVFLVTEVEQNLKINTVTQDFTLPFFIKDQRIYVPLREFCQKAGHTVSWFPSDGHIEVTTEARWEERGLLDSGRKYVFTGLHSGFRFERGENFGKLEYANETYEGGIKTARQAAEIAESKLLRYLDIKIDEAYIVVNYDQVIDAWVAYFTTTKDVRLTGGKGILVMYRETGTVEEWYDGK